MLVCGLGLWFPKLAYLWAQNSFKKPCLIHKLFTIFTFSLPQEHSKFIQHRGNPSGSHSHCSVCLLMLRGIPSLQRALLPEREKTEVWFLQCNRDMVSVIYSSSTVTKCYLFLCQGSFSTTQFDLSYSILFSWSLRMLCSMKQNGHTSSLLVILLLFTSWHQSVLNCLPPPQQQLHRQRRQPYRT